MGSLVCNEGRLRRMLKGGAATAAVVCMIGLSGLPAYAAPATDLPIDSASAFEGATVFLAGVVPAITYPVDGVVFYHVPSIGGTGEAGSTVTIADGSGTVICSVPVDEFGYFYCEGTQLLPAGSSSLTVTATSLDGTTTVGNTVQVLADYEIDVSYPEPGSLLSSMPTFSGKALHGVEVQMVTGAGMPVCTTMSDEWGFYECIPTVPLPVGPLTLAPSMKVVEGSVVVEDPVTWTVIAEPVISSPVHSDVVGDLPVFVGTGTPGADISVMHGRSGLAICSAKVGLDGMFSCTAGRRIQVGGLDVFPELSANGVGSVRGPMITITVAVTPIIVSPSNADVVTGAVEISGTAGIYTNLAILDGNGNTVCSAETDLDGKFSCVANPVLGIGKHTLTPVQTSRADGSTITGSGIEMTVTADGVAPGTPVTSTPVTSTPEASTPATTRAPETTDPATANAVTTTRRLAATGANSTAQLAVVGGLLLLLGAASLLPRFRRRTHG